MEISVQESANNLPVSNSPLLKVTPLSSKTKQPRYLKSAHIKMLTHPVDKNIALSFLLSVIFAAIAIISGIPVVAFLTVFMSWTLTLRRLCMACCLNRCGRNSDPDVEAQDEDQPVQPNFLQRMLCCCYYPPIRMVHPPDSFWLHDSSFNLHIAHCLFFLDQGLSLTKIRDLIRMRVINKTTDTGYPAFPRLARKLLPHCCGYCWVDDEEFSLENHIYAETKDITCSNQLENHVTSLMSQSLPIDRPLWEIRVVNDFGKQKDTVLILRIHHAISDAVSLIRILCNCLSDNEKYLSLKPRFGPNAFFMNLFRTIVVGPLTFLGWVFFTRRDYNFYNRRHKPDRRVIAWTSRIKFRLVNRIKQVMRCTLNDVLVSLTTGAIRAHLMKNGIFNPPNVTLSLPVDLRFDFDETGIPELGANYACVNVRLPCNTEGSIPRLWEVRHKMEELKTSPDPVVMYGAMHYLLCILPEVLAQWLLRTVCKKATVCLANVPGPEEVLTLGSKKLKRILFWMGARPETPVSFSVISYGGFLQFSVSTDKAVIPKPKELVDEVLLELRRLVSLLHKRRIPGKHRRKSNFTAERRQEEIIKPPVQELQQKLYLVQEEVHLLTLKLNALRSVPETETINGDVQISADAALMIRRLEELKEEFSELMKELRRRKSLADGIIINVEDEDLDGELRRPRRRAMSSTGRRSSLATLLTSSSSSGRGYFRSPNIIHQPFVVSTPNLDSAGCGPTTSQQGSVFLQVEQDRFGRRKSDFN